MFSNILKHRIFFLQSSLYLPYSPLLLTNFGAFSSTKFFKFDIIFRTLYFASRFGVQYSSPSRLPTHPRDIPVHEFFNDLPKIYSSSIALFKKHNIVSLEDCLQPDGISFSTYKEIAIQSGAGTWGCISRWYRHLQSVATGSNTSLALLPRFIDHSVVALLSPFSRPSVPINHFTLRFGVLFGILLRPLTRFIEPIIKIRNRLDCNTGSK
jgi:hypothetical protein